MLENLSYIELASIVAAVTVLILLLLSIVNIIQIRNLRMNITVHHLIISNLESFNFDEDDKRELTSIIYNYVYSERFDPGNKKYWADLVRQLRVKADKFNDKDKLLTFINKTLFEVRLRNPKLYSEPH